MNKTLRNLALVALATAPFSANAELVGEGTAANPYLIGTAADLCEAYQYTKSLETVYFVQTADIDMADVKEYTPVVGYDAATYDRPLNYDGRNHVIKNFAPETDVWATGSMYNYGQSIFGVFSGELKNLGIVDINISAAGGRAGAISGYLGQTTANIPVTKVTNVYVTGKVHGGNGNYTGGLFGTTGTAVELTNCFVNVEMSGDEGGKNGALAGRINHETKITNCYVAGTVSGNANLVCSTNTGATTLDGFVVFATGSEVLGLTSTDGVTMANTTATQSAGVDLVKSWAGYSATEEVNGLPALNYALSGAGTEADPYIIASAADLYNAWRFVDNSKFETYYFKQTADIDCEGIEDDYHAILGYNGAYCAKLNYDGGNHVIKNFAPNPEPEPTQVAETNYYYCATLFGFAVGEIKNLGVENAYCASTQGLGILAAYAGYSGANGGCTGNLTVSNVYVHGYVVGQDIDGKKSYVGGMFGTTANEVIMTNCYANVEVTSIEGQYGAGLIGRLDNLLNAENVYVAGTVEGGTNGLLVSGRGRGSVDAYNTICFNTGAENALSETANAGDEEVKVATAETKDALIAEFVAADNSGFSEKKMFEGYPALNWQNVETSGIFDTIVEEVEANGPAVYYNLQGVQVANPENGVYIVRRGNKVTKELVK